MTQIFPIKSLSPNPDGRCTIELTKSRTDINFHALEQDPIVRRENDEPCAGKIRLTELDSKICLESPARDGLEALLMRHSFSPA